MIRISKKGITYHYYPDRDGNNGRCGKPLNNEPDNLIILCRSCHAKHHGHWGLKEVVL